MVKARLATNFQSKVDTANQIVLLRDTNQARGIAQFALDFIDGKLGSGPAQSVIDRVTLFHTDSVVCGLSALALRCNAPTVLRTEAIEEYERVEGKAGATCFGSRTKVAPEKAIVANANAVREWDSNGTVFGYNKTLDDDGFKAGEFGHNDFYPVIVAAAQMLPGKIDGAKAVRAMILSDEIRGRLAETFSLKSYKIDHTVHGAIASAAVYGALLGATVDQIESAIGMTVAHYIPFRAIRAGKQLSDSKGASAAISTEVAIMSIQRSMRGFLGPRDIFRNPQAIFRLNEDTDGRFEAPFDLVLSHSGEDFAVMAMHFKLGLYEHQSAGAIQGVVSLFEARPDLAADSSSLDKIRITIYNPAFDIIGDPAKRDPKTRQSADHSMVFIISRIIKKAVTLGPEKLKAAAASGGNSGLWKALFLNPYDFDAKALQDPETRTLMDKIEFVHGGVEYDSKYPQGIPTTTVFTLKGGETVDSGFVMFPAGHAANTTADLNGILANKFRQLGGLAVADAESLIANLNNLSNLSADEVASVYDCEIQYRDDFTE